MNHSNLLNCSLSLCGAAGARRWGRLSNRAAGARHFSNFSAMGRAVEASPLDAHAVSLYLNHDNYRVICRS
jgi:hypothetical protein